MTEPAAAYNKPVLVPTLPRGNAFASYEDEAINEMVCPYCGVDSVHHLSLLGCCEHRHQLQSRLDALSGLAGATITCSWIDGKKTIQIKLEDNEAAVNLHLNLVKERHRHEMTDDD
jgi:hypothetical protein